MTTKDDNTGRAQDRMMALVPGAAALGRGPAPSGRFSRHDYHHAAAGWGAARSVGEVLEQADTPIEGVHAMFVMIEPDGIFDRECAEERSTRRKRCKHRVLKRRRSGNSFAGYTSHLPPIPRGWQCASGITGQAESETVCTHKGGRAVLFFED